MNRKLLLVILLVLAGCSSHRIGASFLYEYGKAAEYKPSINAGVINEKDENNTN